MDIVNELHILIPKLDSKQKEFIENFLSEFEKIDARILSPNCSVVIEKSFLIIFLEHVSDKNTWIEFKIERREIYITVVGFGYLMWHVAKGEGNQFNNEVREFIKSAFASDFKKILFYNKNGELIKEKLTWKNKPELMKTSVYGNLWNLTKKWLVNKFEKTEYRTSEVSFSKFVKYNYNK